MFSLPSLLILSIMVSSLFIFASYLTVVGIFISSFVSSATMIMASETLDEINFDSTCELRDCFTPIKENDTSYIMYVELVYDISWIDWCGASEWHVNLQQHLNMYVEYLNPRKATRKKGMDLYLVAQIFKWLPSSSFWSINSISDFLLLWCMFVIC